MDKKDEMKEQRARMTVIRRGRRDHRLRARLGKGTRPKRVARR